MKKMLFVLTVLISIIFCISVAVAVSTDDHITGNITVIDSNLVYGYSYSQVSSDYYYTSPGGGKDAYYYLVSAEGEIKLNVSNITVDQGFDQDYVDKNFVNDLKAALDEQDSGPGSGPCIIEVDLYASMGPSQVPMTSASLDGDILTVKINMIKKADCLMIGAKKMFISLCL